MEINNQDIKNVLIDLIHLEYLVSNLRDKWDNEPLSSKLILKIVNLIKLQISEIKQLGCAKDIINHANANKQILEIAQKENIDLIKKSFLLNTTFENFESEFFETYIESDHEISQGLHNEFKKTLDELTNNKKISSPKF